MFQTIVDKCKLLEDGVLEEAEVGLKKDTSWLQPVQGH
jgi:hypothetical protein